jgi:hypothetical protein
MSVQRRCEPSAVLRNERGMALALATFALVVLGGLLLVAFSAAALEQRAGGNAFYAVEAAQAADAGSVTVLAGWNGYRFDSLAVLSSVSLAPAAVGGRPGARYAATVTRLNDQLFLVRSLGIRLDAGGDELARREVAVVVRLPTVSAAAGAADHGGVRLPAGAGALFAREPVVAPTRQRFASGAPAPAVQGTAVAEPLRYRAWAQVY